MKTETVHSLLTAKTLLDEAGQLVMSSSPHACSSGLILLQDALEIVFLAALRERDVDQNKNIESFSFDQLIGELRSIGVRVPKVGTLKALNKQRVVVKHYGQLADPTATNGYLNCTNLAITDILNQVVGKNLDSLFLTDLLDEKNKSLIHLRAAEGHLQRTEYYECLLEVRKAYFVEIENDYCIYNWRTTAGARLPLWLDLFGGGRKAPYYTKNKEWIEKNVREPTQYVQVDFDKLRMDAAEWGINTSELRNIATLTPQLVRLETEGPWYVKADSGFKENMSTSGNATYCLDRMIAIVYKKQQHRLNHRQTKRDVPWDTPPVYLGNPVFDKPDSSAQVIGEIQENHTYHVNYQTTGFDGATQYLNITLYPPGYDAQSLGEGPFPIMGYIIDHGP